MRTDEFIIYQKTIPARPAENVSFPEGLSEEIAEFLKTQGIHALYSHQAEMFEKAEEKKNIVITTSTASGKTLSFLRDRMEDIDSIGSDGSLDKGIFYQSDVLDLCESTGDINRVENIKCAENINRVEDAKRTESTTGLEQPRQIRHPKYGIGTITREDDMMLEALFDAYGLKEFLKGFTEFEYL